MYALGVNSLEYFDHIGVLTSTRQKWGGLDSRISSQGPSCSYYLQSQYVRLQRPRTCGRIPHGIGGGRAVGPSQHAGHPPRHDRRMASYPRLRNRLRRRRPDPLLPGSPRRSLSLLRPVQSGSPGRPRGHRRDRPTSAGALLPFPRRQGTPAGLRWRSQTLARRHRPRASGRRCRSRNRPDHLQPRNNGLLGRRHLQLAPLSPIPSSAPKPPGGES